MKKLLILLFTLIMGFALTMPAFAQDAAPAGQEAPKQDETKKDEMKKDEMGGKEAKKKSHRLHAKKKGAKEGKQEGQEGANPGEAPKQ